MEHIKEAKEKKDDSYLIFGVIVSLLSFPMGMIVGRWVPEIIIPISDGISIHNMLSWFIAFTLISLILSPIKKLVSVLALLTFITLAIFVWTGKISKNEIVAYYKNGVSQVTQIEIAGRSINNQTAIQSAIEKDKGVKEFVHQHENRYLNRALLPSSILKSFAMFDVISKKWDYKHDPAHRELFRPPSETIKTKRGDCDDHAICLATCMKKCGARTRIVHAEHHLYPELYVGRVEQKEKVVSTIHKLYPSSKFKNIHFVEEDGELWLNMDYTAKYPGGKYLSDVHFERMEL